MKGEKRMPMEAHMWFSRTREPGGQNLHGVLMYLNRKKRVSFQHSPLPRGKYGQVFFPAGLLVVVLSSGASLISIGTVSSFQSGAVGTAPSLPSVGASTCSLLSMRDLRLPSRWGLVSPLAGMMLVASSSCGSDGLATASGAATETARRRANSAGCMVSRCELKTHQHSISEDLHCQLNPGQERVTQRENMSVHGTRGIFGVLSPSLSSLSVCLFIYLWLFLVGHLLLRRRKAQWPKYRKWILSIAL